MFDQKSLREINNGQDRRRPVDPKAKPLVRDDKALADAVARRERLNG